MTQTSTSSGLWKAIAGLKDVFNEQECLENAHFLLGQTASERLHAGLRPSELIEQLLRETTAPDGTPMASKQEVLTAVSEALNDYKAELNPGLANVVTVKTNRSFMQPLPSTEDEHTKQLNTEVCSWSSLEGFGFGIEELDKAFGGIYPGETMAIVGAPGSMKTSLALSAVDRFLTMSQGRVLMFSLDMPARKIAARRLMRELDCFESELFYMIRQQDPRVVEAYQRIKNYDAGRFRLVGKLQNGKHYSWEQLYDIVVQLAPELVIIDYLTLIGEYKSELDAVYDLMPKIISMADNCGIAVMLLSQMGRGSRAAQKSNAGGHAAGGHYVEDAVDVELELLKEETEDGKPAVIATVAKNRKGRTGGNFKLDIDPRTLSFGITAEAVDRVRPQAKVFNI